MTALCGGSDPLISQVKKQRLRKVMQQGMWLVSGRAIIYRSIGELQLPVLSRDPGAELPVVKGSKNHV